MTGARRPQLTCPQRRNTRQPAPHAVPSGRRALPNLPTETPSEADMTVTTPRSNTRATSPLRWSARPRAPCGRWATGAGRSPGSRLWRIASAFPPDARQWLWGRRSPLTVAGAAAALRSKPRTAFPFHPPSLGKETGREPSRGESEAKCVRSCQQDACGRRWFALVTWRPRHGAVKRSVNLPANNASAMVDRSRESRHRPAHACRC